MVGHGVILGTCLKQWHVPLISPDLCRIGGDDLTTSTGLVTLVAHQHPRHSLPHPVLLHLIHPLVEAHQAAQTVDVVDKDNRVNISITRVNFGDEWINVLTCSNDGLWTSEISPVLLCPRSAASIVLHQSQQSEH